MNWPYSLSEISEMSDVFSEHVLVTAEEAQLCFGVAGV